MNEKKETTIRKSILNPIEVCKDMPNTVKLYVGEPKDNNYFLIDNDQGLINYITQNAFRWTFDSNSNKEYGLLSASNEECKEIYGKTTIRLHQLVCQYYFGETKIFLEYKDQEYRGRKKKGDLVLVIEHLNNNERDNRIQNLHITTQRVNKNKSIIDELIDYNKSYIYYPKNQFGKFIYNERKYVIQFNSRPGTFFKFGDNKVDCNTFIITFEADQFDDYLKAFEKVSTLTKFFLDKTEEAKEIRKVVKEADQEERRSTFSVFLGNSKNKTVEDLEIERIKNIQEIVNSIYLGYANSNSSVKSYLVMPIVNTMTGYIHQIRVEDVEQKKVYFVDVEPNSISKENYNNYLKDFKIIDHILN